MIHVWRGHTSTKANALSCHLKESAKTFLDVPGYLAN